MKNKKGITLISLAITILVIMVLTSVATYSGINAINMSKLTAFTTELKIMQTQINSIYQKYKENDIIELNNELYYGQDKEEADDVKTILEIGEELDLTQKAILNELARDAETGIESADGYRYWSKDLISTLKIEGIRQDFYVNVSERSIVSCQGLKYKGKMYYTLNQIPDSMYNVKYDNPNTNGPTFECSAKKIGSNKWEITVSNIQYDGYIDKWDVQYKLEGKDYWNTSKDLSFVVDTTGNYTIRLKKDSIVSADVPLVIEIGAGERVTVKNEQYTDKDGDIAVIPVGFCIVPGCDDVSEGLVVSDNEGDTEADPSHIVAQGNQFVWVPVEFNDNDDVTENDFKNVFKREAGYSNGSIQQGNFELDELTSEDYSEPRGDGINVDKGATGTEKEVQEMYKSVKDNRGFYIGRYEAGAEGGTYSTSTGWSKATKVVCKKEMNVYNYIHWSKGIIDETEGAVELARGFAKQQGYTSVKSTLCYGVQWDAVMRWMGGIENLTVPGKKYVEDSTGMGWYEISGFKSTGIDIDSDKSNKVKNIYDMAGNLKEWTMEFYGINVQVSRGGNYSNKGSSSPASSRGTFYDSEHVYNNYGFRPTLYLYDES